MTKLEKIMQNEQIELFSVLPFSSCEVRKEHLLKRLTFKPLSVIIYAIPYYVSIPENISAYASSRDYHLYMSALHTRLEKAFSEAFVGESSCGFSDHTPIDERLGAVKAGLGVFGKNGLILTEKYGSYVFLGEMLTSVSHEKLGMYQTHDIKGCMGCGACKNACPTGCLSGEDHACLSEITQKKGSLTEAEIDLMRKENALWGCDICQTVCPYNKNPRVTPIAFFHEKRIEALTEDMLLKMDEESFRERAFSWRGRETILRNLNYLKKRK